MEGKKKLKITNQKQFERLVHLMERNPEIARGFAKTGTTKLDIKQAWDNFAVEINSFGPPLRSGKEWQKVWIDYKAKVKKAVAANKKALKETGGGPYTQVQLAPLQKTVDELLHLTTSINPGGRCFGSKNYEENLSRAEETETQSTVAETVPVNTNCEENMRLDFPPETERVEPDHDVDSSVLNDVSNNNNVRNIRHTPRAKRNQLETKRTELLENQTETQAKILEIYKKIEKNTYSISKSLKKSCDLKQEKIKLMKAHMHQQAVDNIEKRKFKIQDIELKKRELDLKQEELMLMGKKNEN